MGGVHPIEHLRYLARSVDVDPTWFVPEAADALGALAHDRSALVMACRKLVEHHPGCGPLWWLASQALTAPDVRAGLGDARRTFSEDPTGLQASLALAEASTGTGEPVVVRCQMLGPSGASGCDRYPRGDRDVWVLAGVGTVVPPQVQAVTAGARMIPLADIDRVIRPAGAMATSLAAGGPDFPVVPELLGRA